MQSDVDFNSDGNDRTAEFLRLLNRHEHALNAYIFTLNPHWSDAEDIAQELRIRLWKQFAEYQPGSDFGAWGRAIAYYLVLTHRAKTSRDRLRFGPAFYDAVSEAVAAKPELVSRRREALLCCMEKLNATRRSLIESYYSDGQPLRELAKEQGRSYDAVRKTVYRTQRMLADCIQSRLQKNQEVGE
jgi:RNA polymerase sigma-70 factor (ECF subfamily)